MQHEPPPPSWRKPAGVIAIISGLTMYAGLVGSLSEPIGRLNALVQGVIYLVLGIIWILPLKPLLRWMETGRFR